jgi:negative regulator of sigma E activity
MNCERCQELISGVLDGSLSREDEATLNLHLEECLECVEVKRDLESIVSFCHSHRGEYVAFPNERAVWLRICNAIEAENGAAAAPTVVLARREPFWNRWLNHSWQLSLPQLAASAAAIVLAVSLTTIVGMRRIDNRAAKNSSGNEQATKHDPVDIDKRFSSQQQAINYWNARIELNKARWSPQMRDTFDRNLSVINQAVSDSLNELNKNPHDEVSEEMLNGALNEKINLLREFSEL